MEIAIRLFEGQGLGNQIFTIVALYKLSVNLKREPIILEFENFKDYNLTSLVISDSTLFKLILLFK